MTNPIYLDYNATAPVRPEALEAVMEALALTGNASSVHVFGRSARNLLEKAREEVAALAAARPDQVVFTAGGTEANNLALLGAGPKPRRILVSAGEHDSVLRAADADLIPLTPQGLVDLSAMEEALSRLDGPALVSVMHANNETGVIQPLPEVAALAKKAGALLHCDAVQSAGKLDLSGLLDQADLVTLSAHKLGGPQGVGALLVGGDLQVTSLLKGGGQERGQRAGTENLPGAAGFGAAAAAARRDLAGMSEIAALRDRLETQVLQEAPEARVFGADVPRLPNTSCIALPGLAAETQVMALDLAGIAVSAGSACSSGKVQPSHVLRAMGAGDDEAGCAIRVSLGWRSRREDVEAFAAAWAKLYKKSRQQTSSAA